MAAGDGDGGGGGGGLPDAYAMSAAGKRQQSEEGDIISLTKWSSQTGFEGRQLRGDFGPATAR
jgi:hypothetical protein